MLHKVAIFQLIMIITMWKTLFCNATFMEFRTIDYLTQSAHNQHFFSFWGPKNKELQLLQRIFGGKCSQEPIRSHCLAIILHGSSFWQCLILMHYPTHNSSELSNNHSLLLSPFVSSAFGCAYVSPNSYHKRLQLLIRFKSSSSTV
jgi:hypothetical protein